jgi:CBS domain containing-hemolysin-like protein
MSFSAVNRIRLKNMAVKSKRAALALKLLEMYDKLLSTVLIGNNTVNIAASSIAALLFIDLFGPKSVSAAAAIMTILIILITDITPKALAKENPERTAIRVSPLLRFFMFIFSPFNYITSSWKNMITKVFPVKQAHGATEEELLTFVEEMRQDGGINNQEEKMIRQVIEFDDLKVSGIFTPRVDVAAVALSFTIGEIDSVFAKTGFSRLPVYRDTIDNIIGIILLKDFHHQVINGTKNPESIIKPVVFVTKTIKIAHLLKTLQEKQTHLAVVIDEYGGTLGIVTIEDIVEELVGEIWDEHDKIALPVRKTPDGLYTVQGNVNFKDMLHSIFDDNRYNNDDDIPDTTVANWIMETIGRLPRVGERLSWRNLSIKISKALRQRVFEVRVKVDEAANADKAACADETAAADKAAFVNNAE